MKSHRHVQLGAHEAHQFPPECGSEHRIAVGHHRLRHAVESNDVGEEGLCHGLCKIRVSQGDEVAIFAESINNRQYDGFPPDARQRLHEVKTDVGPDRLRDRQQHEQASRMEMF
ncbi:hypothetical protein E2562_024175 [Oryza meyeriana var. granulata]|uniref:Uncharacterized protein n=1 Tax=Oryza meyeriana var. granulata TaxID=110450 RepID=A0A6G1CIA9_9ORYZ|nr:hypothetical protein E2562_024175 [Oryza meyeriana var. granulata]